MGMNEIVWKILQQKIHGQINNEKEFFEGLNQYTQDCGIDRLIDGVGIDRAEQAVNAFLSPLLDNKEDYIISYFSNYPAIKKLQYLSKQIGNIAYELYLGKNVFLDEDLENDFVQLTTKLNADRRIQKSLESLISETFLDLDYIKNRNKNEISLRLMRRVRQ